VLYLPQVQEATEAGDYVAARIFAAVETTMLWKPLNNPTCPFEEKEPTNADTSSAKTERPTFLFCANTWGDLIAKPLLPDTKLCPNLLRGNKKPSQVSGVLAHKQKSLDNSSP